jgi:hypothetical protein
MDLSSGFIFGMGRLALFESDPIKNGEMSLFNIIGSVQKIEDFGDNEMLEQIWRTSKKVVGF